MTPAEIKEWIFARCTRSGKCLLWQGAVDSEGVPQMRDRDARKVRPVRRVLLEAMGVDIAGKLATTRCNNPLCMDEHHVVAWSRTRLQKRSAKKTVMNVTWRTAITVYRRKTATLDMDKVRQMRAEGLTAREAAERYGVVESTALDALRGTTWKEYASPFAGLLR